MYITIIAPSVHCNWCGRNGDSIEVYGANGIKEARAVAMEFAELPEGITLDEGRLATWGYEEPQPADWQDHYLFNTCDAHPVDQREWWEK